MENTLIIVSFKQASQLGYILVHIIIYLKNNL